jgi:alanine racemase
MEADRELLRPTAATIDLALFDRNVEAVRAKLPPGARLVTVLKADAYGHGAVALARRLGADEVAMIAVALFEEAMELREAGITLPILTLGPLSTAQIVAAQQHRITIGITGPEMLAAAVEASKERPVVAHLKLDSGMNRMGSTIEDLDAVAGMIRSATRLRIDAIYTHFANAGDPNDDFTGRQLSRFREMLARLESLGVSARIHHTSNSAATMLGIAQSGDYVRVGLSLYGAEPLDTGTSRLSPILRWTTRIARLKKLRPGDQVGYGTTWTAERSSILATLPVGYADGYDRLLSNRGEVLIRGRRAKVVGRVSMDLVTVDVTDVPDVSAGDEVILLGSDGNDEISAEQHAAWTNTIPYEVFCRISARVPRIYVEADSSSIHSKFI